MTNMSIKEQLQPALLDRLTDDDRASAAIESAARSTISMRRLRESVQRDLSWLLNTLSLDATLDLTAFSQVERSVLNFGMPSFAGLPLASIDANQAAQRIGRAIETFEPRLFAVNVTPQAQEGQDGVTLAFLIEAMLWGQPAAQHLSLRTSIDVGTGDVSIADNVG